MGVWFHKVMMNVGVIESYTITVHTGFGKFYEVMGIENATFQDLKRLKRKIFKMAVESFGFLFGDILEIS